MDRLLPPRRLRRRRRRRGDPRGAPSRLARRAPGVRSVSGVRRPQLLAAPAGAACARARRRRLRARRAAALLVSCGSSSAGLIPAADAGPAAERLRSRRRRRRRAATATARATEAALAEDRTRLRGAAGQRRRRAAQHAAIRGSRTCAPDALALCAQPLPPTTDRAPPRRPPRRHTAPRRRPRRTPTTPTQTTPTAPRPRRRPPAGAGGGTAAPAGETPLRRRRQRRGRRQRRRCGRRRAARKAANERVEIAGRYRLEGRLGFGGMSTVHLALDLRLERQVAVKLLAEHLAEDPTFVVALPARGAGRRAPRAPQHRPGLRLRAGRDHRSVLHRDGVHRGLLLRGDPARRRLGRGRTRRVSIIEQACEGLDYAHRHGVVHRDVKPGNLLRAREGEVKLADFGIAKATEQSSITQVGSVLGTAAYLAPEQARGEEAGPQRRPLRARRRRLPADLRAPAL